MEPDFTKLTQLLDKSDSFAAADFLEYGGPPDEVAARYAAMAQRLYQERKDVVGMLAIGRAGIHYGLAVAARDRADDPDRALKVRGIVKGIAYNLGSNTWPAWEDAGVVLTGSDIALGGDAARLNLRLGRELERPALPMCNAHWLVGAHDLVAKRYSHAALQFRQAGQMAQMAERLDFAAMSRGYQALAGLFETPNNPHEESQFADAVMMLETLATDDSKFFAKQLVDVRRFCERFLAR